MYTEVGILHAKRVSTAGYLTPAGLRWVIVGMRGGHLRGKVQICRGEDRGAEGLLEMARAGRGQEGSEADDEKLHTKLTSLSASRTRTRRLIAVLPDLVVFHRKGFNDCERSSMKSAAFLCSLISSSSDASMVALKC